MISLFTGKPGEGKTLIMTQKAYKEAKKGRQIYSNYKLEFDKEENINVKYYKEIEELVDVKEALILMDEAQIYINSRNWEKLPLEFQYKLQLHRHDGLDIWGTAQHISRVDIVCRQLIHNYYKCKKMFDLGGMIYFLLIRLDEDQINKEMDKIRILGRELVIFNKKNPPLYDTYGKIDVVEKEVIIKKFKKCQLCGKETLIF